MNNNIVFFEKKHTYKLDIPRNGFTINETNQEFSDTLFTNWSYPFESFLTPELIRTYGDPSDTNQIFNNRKDWGFLSVEGTVYPACLKYVGITDKKIKFQIEFGYESLEVFEKKLNEIDLEIIPFGFGNNFPVQSVSKKFPEINIAFPQVEIKRFNDDTKDYVRKGVYNNYNPITGMIESNFDEDDDAWYSFKPYVYLMHILSEGFKSENLEISGDILKDPELRYSLLNHNNIPYEKIDLAAEKKISVNLKPDPEKFSQGNKYQVTSEITATANVSGQYYFSVLESADKIVYFKAELRYLDFNNVPQYYSLELSESQTIGEIDVQKLLPNYSGYIFMEVKLKVTIEYTGLSDDVQRNFSVFLLRKEGNAGHAYIFKTYDIDAKSYLPDITFGTLVNAIKKSRKYKIIISGNKIYFINSTINYAQVKNLSFFDTAKKEILTNERESYVLKLTSPEEYKHLKYLINTKEILTDFQEDKNNYETMEIDCYPLNVTAAGTAVDNVITAVELVEENSTVCLLRYEGLQSGYNRCLNMNSFLIPYIYRNFYNFWIQNRLTSMPVQWKFYTDNYQMRDLTALDKIYSKQNYHTIIDMTKKFIGETAYEIELKTENRP